MGTQKNTKVFDVSVFIFCFPLRGLFASHYTETHYQEDGSAVTGAHNFTVRWHSKVVDLYVQVDMQWSSADIL